MPSNTKEYKKLQSERVGMGIGSAAHKLRKMLLFQFVVQCGEDTCFQCGEKIEDIDDLSIEHKVPWLNSETPRELFFDLDNIAFSHLKCNVKAGDKRGGTGTRSTLSEEERLERARERKRRWQGRNKEKHKEKNRRYRENNREKLNAYGREYRSKMKTNTEPINSGELEEMPTDLREADAEEPTPQ